MQSFESAAGITLETDNPVALKSPDHLCPWGTRRDNSRNKRFNHKLYRLVGSRRTLRILDLGCSGGGFVRDCIDDGQFAVGLEGSDYSKRVRRAEWATIPDFLFTCDVTQPFALNVGAEPLKFDVVTSWELIEHIAEEDLAKVAGNVERHLADGGIWIMSVSPNEEVINGVALHQTVQPKSWWIEKFAALGWRHSEAHTAYFREQYVRGIRYGAPGSFHLVLSRSSVWPAIPKSSWKERAFDYWLNSPPSRLLRMLLLGPQ